MQHLGGWARGSVSSGAACLCEEVGLDAPRGPADEGEGGRDPEGLKLGRAFFFFFFS